jgi:hypothetical protein
MFASGKRSTGDENTNCHCGARHKEERSEHNEYPTNDSWRRFLIARAWVMSSVKQESAGKWNTAAGKTTEALLNRRQRNEKSRATADALYHRSLVNPNR